MAPTHSSKVPDPKLMEGTVYFNLTTVFLVSVESINMPPKLTILKSRDTSPLSPQSSDSRERSYCFNPGPWVIPKLPTLPRGIPGPQTDTEENVT